MKAQIILLIVVMLLFWFSGFELTYTNKKYERTLKIYSLLVPIGEIFFRFTVPSEIYIKQPIRFFEYRRVKIYNEDKPKNKNSSIVKSGVVGDATYIIKRTQNKGLYDLELYKKKGNTITMIMSVKSKQIEVILDEIELYRDKYLYKINNEGN